MFQHHGIEYEIKVSERGRVSWLSSSMEGEVKVNLLVTLGKLSVSQFCGQSINLTVSLSVCLSATQPVVCWLFSLSYSYLKQSICRSFTHGLARHTQSL